MNEIELWLNGPRNYIEGVDLYNRHGNSSNLKHILTVNGETPRNRETLAYELTKLSKQEIKQPVKQVVAIYTPVPQAKQKVESRFNNKSSFQRADEEVNQIIAAKNRLYKEYVAIFHQLIYMNEEDRRVNAHKCLDLMEEVQRLWDKIDYYDEHGRLPVIQTTEKKKVSEMDKAELLALRNNSLRPNVSRYRRLLSDAKTGITRSKYETLLQQYEVQLEEVNSKLRMS